jgi:NAD(P)-dependent dehydrogenase (short-subunit alcohol dehydrogenase family)
MQKRFEGKVAIVTGAASGIGLATALRLGAEGASVVLADIDENVHAVAQDLPDVDFPLLSLTVDVTDEKQVEKLMADTLERFGQLDVLVANAGIGGLGTVDEIDTALWERVMDINVNSVFLCMRHAVPALRKTRGAIVSTASVMGLVAPRNAAAYACSKGAIINLTRAAAIDYAPAGVRVNAVCPGHLDMPTRVGGAAARKVDNRDLVSRYPLGRLGSPEEIAAAIAFLASDEASFITGTHLVVDGGFTAQ